MHAATKAPHPVRFSSTSAGLRLALVTAVPLFLVMAGTPAAASPDDAPVPGQFCTNTAKALRNSCPLDAQGGYWQAIAACRNTPQPAKAEACASDAKRELDAALSLCDEQFAGRLQACGRLGETVYAPRIDPADFVDRVDNPFFRLRPGTPRIPYIC
jgi:hypothetical protein